MAGNWDSDTERPRVGDDTVVYAIGDLHGRADLLAELHRLIAIDVARRRQSRRVVVYLGDYIDRGPESRQVLDLLLDQPLAGFEAAHLKGNHEDFMLRFLAGETEYGFGWLMNGAVETFESYGIAASRFATVADLDDLRRQLIERLPARQRAFLDRLELMHVEGDYAFVHAGIRPGMALDRQRESDLLWIRDAFLDWTGRHDKVVVHGHSISRAPEVRPNRIGIDTGAFGSDVLTSLVLVGETQDFIQTAGWKTPE